MTMSDQSTAKTGGASFSPIHSKENHQNGRVFYRESWTFETAGPYVMEDVGFEGFLMPSSRYHHDLARLCVALTAGSYTYHAIEKTCASFGFDHIKRCNYDPKDNNLALNADEAACAFARKDLNIHGEIKTLIAVIIRGSIGSEMLSNFVIESDTGFHKGFSIPTEYLEEQLRLYVEEEALDPESCKIIITGHSRGAAIANFLTLRLNAGLAEVGPFAQDDIYTYTFGTPNSVDCDGPEISDDLQKNIFNIINFQDVVGHLPGKHYSPGNNLYFNYYDAENYSLYNATFKRRYNTMVVSAKYQGWKGIGNYLLSRIDGLPSKALAKTLGGFITKLTLEDPKASKSISLVSACLGLGFLGTAAIKEGWTGAVCAGMLAKKMASESKKIADRIYTNHVMETYLCLMEISQPGRDFFVDPAKGGLSAPMLDQGVAIPMRGKKKEKERSFSRKKR